MMKKLQVDAIEGHEMNAAVTKAIDSIQRFTKWRIVLAGWHLGTATINRPGVQAMRDLRELTLLLRAEVNALAVKCVERGMFTQEEFTIAVGVEADLLSKELEKKFPGYAATDDGIAITPQVAKETNEKLGFPY